MKRIHIDIDINLFRYHPLGFFYASNKISETENVRLHVWTRQFQAKVDNVAHTHSYDFSSEIFLGKLKNTIWQFSEQVGGDIFEHKVHYNSCGSRLIRTGRRGSLAECSSFICCTGERYRIRSDQIHVAAVVDVPCVTLVRTRRAKNVPYVYGRDSGEAGNSRGVVTRDDAAEITNLLNEIGLL
jgi:hypothetical protein